MKEQASSREPGTVSGRARVNLAGPWQSARPGQGLHYQSMGGLRGAFWPGGRARGRKKTPALQFKAQDLGYTCDHRLGGKRIGELRHPAQEGSRGPTACLPQALRGSSTPEHPVSIVWEEGKFCQGPVLAPTR